jgi:hypothetical protein
MPLLLGATLSRSHPNMVLGVEKLSEFFEKFAQVAP